LGARKVIVNKPLNWGESNLAESCKSLYFEVDDDNNIKATPIVMYDPTLGPTTTGGYATIKGIDTTGAVRNSAVTLIIDGNALLNQPAVVTQAVEEVYNPGIPGMQLVRTPNTIKQNICTTVAATAVWTPTAGKKFRVMGGTIIPAAGMGAAGVEKISLLDSATDIGLNFQTYLPIAASIQHQPQITFDLKPNGYLSAAANNVLNVTLTTAITAGAISVTVWGTEE